MQTRYSIAAVIRNENAIVERYHPQKKQTCNDYLYDQTADAFRTSIRPSIYNAKKSGDIMLPCFVLVETSKPLLIDFFHLPVHDMLR